MASGLISSTWSSGTFDAGHRSFTEFVEGSICIPQHLILVTLSGQARHLEVTSSSGHCYRGGERANMVSFVPAHHDRQFRLHGVEAAWASISFAPALLGTDDSRLDGTMFTNREDAFISSMLGSSSGSTGRTAGWTKPTATPWSPAWRTTSPAAMASVPGMMLLGRRGYPLGACGK
ncbi:hypothetical protein ACE0DR_26980 [Azotobacter sp. CWF10]